MVKNIKSRESLHLYRLILLKIYIASQLSWTITQRWWVFKHPNISMWIPETLKNRVKGGRVWFNGNSLWAQVKKDSVKNAWPCSIISCRVCPKRYRGILRYKKDAELNRMIKFRSKPQFLCCLYAIPFPFRGNNYVDAISICILYKVWTSVQSTIS